MEKGNIVSIEDRIPKLKEQRRKKANRRLITLLLLFFFLIICIVYFQSPLSNVKNVVVSGNELYSRDVLINKSGITQKTNIWKIDSGEIERKIEKSPEIKEATIETKLPSTVYIKVKEYKRIAYISKEKLFLPVLENGQMLNEKQMTEIPVNAPILIGFKEGRVLNEMIEGLEELPREVLNSISEINYTPKETDEFHITLFMNDGYEVSATLRSFSDKMSHYPSIASQLDPNVKGIIDLEVGSYFKAYETEGAENLEEEGQG